MLTRHWQIAPLEMDKDVVTDLEDINQCIINILSTRKGSDVTRPDFGSDHLTYLDTPEDIFIPNVTREVILAIQTWEKRVALDKVTFSGSAPHMTMSIHWRLADNVAGEISQTDIRIIAK